MAGNTSGLRAELAATRALAVEAKRPDLVERLDHCLDRVVTREVPVVVVGEYKQGKSTLINALLRTDVCPVDADLVTAVPTVIRYGTPPSVTARYADADQPVRFDRLRELVAEDATGGPVAHRIEVRLDRTLLRGGLTLVDTPGVGGLDSAQGNITLGELALARAALFVSDAAQELTAPELEFLVRVVERCPAVVCVLTKTDLHGEWRRMVELNRDHLARAGLQLPIVAVSSYLRMRAQARRDSTLNDESNFPRLLAMLRRDVVGAAETAAVEAAAADVAYVVGQLREQVGAERAAAQDPRAGAGITARFHEKARRAQALTGGTWQSVLSDGIQDLTADVDHDLRERLRMLVRRGETLIDEGDPRETWRDVKTWAAREATAAAVDNLLLLVTRADHLAREVAGRFDVEYDSLDVDLPSPDAALAKAGTLDARFDKNTVQQLLGAFTAARVAYGGIYLLGAAGTVLDLSFAAPVGLAVGLTLGRKLVQKERERLTDQRRQQAKQELRRYVDEVTFHVGRDSRDAVRRTQRFLRDELAARATVAERSSSAAADAARSIAQLPSDERGRRAEKLEADWQDLQRLADRVPARTAAA